MSIFNFWKRAEKTDTPIVDPLLSALIKGEPITRKRALTLPAVSGAVDYIAGTVASMPVKLYKKTGGKVKEIENDSRLKLLNDSTRDTLDGFQFKKAMVEDYLLGKGGYAYVKKYRNEVISLHYVEEDSVSIDINADPINKVFVINVQGNLYYPFEFVKLLRNSKDGASGVGLVVEVSTALETAFRTLCYQLGLVKRGGNKKGFLKSQNKMGKEEFDKLKLAWNRLYANNEENVVLLNKGVEFQESSNTSVEMQLDQNKQTLKKEINDIFHISEDQAKTFKEAIFPIVRAFETALNQVLLLEDEKKAGLFFKFDVKEITKASVKERYEAYKVAKEAGFITVNEIRKEENMNSVKGGDVLNVGLSAALLDVKTGQIFVPNTGETSDFGDKTGENGEKIAENDENVEKEGENPAKMNDNKSDNEEEGGKNED